MTFITMVNNVAHKTGDTSTGAVTRSKAAVNDSIFDIMTSRHRFNWMRDRITPKTITLSTSANSYS